MYNEQDFIKAIEQHQGIVHKVCKLYINNTADKQDLFQEIVLNAWRGNKNFKGEAKFSTWLYKVALNTAITFFKKEKRQIQTDELNSISIQMADIDYTQEEQVTAMHMAIADLSKIDKALVVLYLEDYDYNEIGEIIGITANNVAVKMNRIKIKLKENSKKYLL